MALGNEIILTPEPRGRRIEVYNGTEADILPGTCVMATAAGEEDAGGRLPYEPYNTAQSGVPKPIAVVEIDWWQGKTADDAIEPGKRMVIYFPLPGDELNMLVQDQAGTGATSDYSVGDPLRVEDGTGLLIDGTLGTAGFSNPFECRENYSDMAADTRLHCIFTGY